MKLFVILMFFAINVMSYGKHCDRYGLNIIYEWKFVEYDWDSPEQMQQAIDSGDYNATACVLYDVDKAKDGRIFVTSVREEGVPASLMTVTDKIGKGGPIVRPYPNWAWHQLYRECSKRITGVYRVAIKCNHLFVLDCGKVGDDKLCPAQLLIFDLSTDKLVKGVEIPDDFAYNQNGSGLLVTPIVDVPSCENVLKNAVVFMADTVGYGLVVWRAYDNTFCRFESIYMLPTDTFFSIVGDSFTLDDGILGMTLVKRKGGKDLYYAPLAGKEIFRMKEFILTGQCLSPNRTNELTQLAAELSGQTGPIASKDCALFFSNVPETSVLCADTGKPINSSNTVVIANNSVTLQFVSGMKTSYGKLCFLTNRYARTMTDSRNLTETNYRILCVCLEEIRHNTSCFESCKDDRRDHLYDPRHYPRYYHGRHHKVPYW